MSKAKKKSPFTLSAEDAEVLAAVYVMADETFKYFVLAPLAEDPKAPITDLHKQTITQDMMLLIKARHILEPMVKEMALRDRQSVPLSPIRQPTVH